MIGKRVEKVTIDLMKKTIRTNSVLVSCSGCGKTVSRVETTQWVRQLPWFQEAVLVAVGFSLGLVLGVVSVCIAFGGFPGATGG